MSVFNHIDSDIDRTRPGQPYVVDSDGWGWFMLIFLMILPFLLLSVLVSSFAKFFVEYLPICLITYSVASLFLGILLYCSPKVKYRTLGIISTILTMIPLVSSLTVYAIPYVLLAPGTDSTFDFILLFALLGGVTFLIFSLCRLFKNGILHFVMALGFLLLSLLLLSVCLDVESDLLTINTIRMVYGL